MHPRIAELVDYLNDETRKLCAVYGSVSADGRGSDAETAPVLASSAARRATDRTNRFSTSEAAQPRDTDPSRAWDELTTARLELEAAIAVADGLALGEVTAPHPALGTFTGYDWIAFAGTHVARHAAQILEGA